MVLTSRAASDTSPFTSTAGSLSWHLPERSARSSRQAMSPRLLAVCWAQFRVSVPLVLRRPVVIRPMPVVVSCMSVSAVRSPMSSSVLLSLASRNVWHSTCPSLARCMFFWLRSKRPPTMRSPVVMPPMRSRAKRASEATSMRSAVRLAMLFMARSSWRPTLMSPLRTQPRSLRWRRTSSLAVSRPHRTRWRGRGFRAGTVRWWRCHRFRRCLGR